MTRLSMFLCPSSPPPAWTPSSSAARTTSVAARATTTSPRSGRRWSSTATRTGGPPNGVFQYSGPADRHRATSPTGRATRSPSASGRSAPATLNDDHDPHRHRLRRQCPPGVTRNTARMVDAEPVPPAFQRGSPSAPRGRTTTRGMPARADLGQTWAFGLAGYYAGQRPAAAEPEVSRTAARTGSGRDPDAPACSA